MQTKISRTIVNYRLEVYKSVIFNAAWSLCNSRLYYS